MVPFTNYVYTLQCKRSFMSYLVAGQHFPGREAAEALKARNIPAQGKHAESVRRPGYNGDNVRVPRPLWPQSAKLTGAKEAMELIDCCGNFALRPIVAGHIGRPFRALFGWDFYPGRRALRALALGYLRSRLRR